MNVSTRVKEDIKDYYVAEATEFSGVLLTLCLRELGAPSTHPYLDVYWTEAGRFPYRLCIGDEIIGFALVRSAAHAFQMAEFYVAPAWWRRRLGRAELVFFTQGGFDRSLPPSPQ